MMYPKVSSVEDKISFKSRWRSELKQTIYHQNAQVVEGDLVVVTTVTNWGTSVIRGVVYQTCPIKPGLFSARIVIRFSDYDRNKVEPIYTCFVRTNRHGNKKIQFISKISQ